MLMEHQRNYSASFDKRKTLTFITQLPRANLEISWLLDQLYVNYGKLAPNITSKLEILRE